MVYVADGDMRNAINNLQAVYISSGKVDKEDVFKVCDVPSFDLTNGIIKELLNGNLDKGLQDFDKLWKQDYCLHDLIIYINKSVERFEGINIDLRMEMMVLGSKLKLNQARGVTSKTQIVSFLAQLCHLGITYQN